MLNTKTALVTGSSSGIGQAIAIALAQQGTNLVLHGLLDIEAGNKLARDFTESYGIRCQFSNADISKVSAIEDLFGDVKDDIDILVNNAGIQHTDVVENFPVDKWNDILAINLSAVFHTSRLALPGMQQKAWGRIINIASVHGLVASKKKAAYCAAKHGLIGLTKVIALENANKGITANAICPGWVDTALIASQIESNAAVSGLSIAEARDSLISEKQPMLDMTTPASIAELVIYLCSKHANTMTGCSLPVDGGWTAQ